MIYLYFFLVSVHALNDQSLALCKLAEALPTLQTIGWQNCSLMNDTLSLVSRRGVVLNDQKQVLTIVLSSNVPRLSGTLPTEIGLFRSLANVLINNHAISGTLPTQLALPTLQSLRLDGNQLSGTLPVEITNCGRLTILHVYNNLLSGSLPARLFQSNLAEVVIYNNLFSGLIPDLNSELKFFSAAKNQLQGFINPSMPKPSKLTSISLLRNRLTGTFPSFLTEHPQLSYLDLSHNLFTGSVPTVLNKISRVEYLDLSGNQFTGLIPDLWDQLLVLRVLNLRNNDFTGPLPASLSTNRILTYLDVSSNKLAGIIPVNLTGSLIHLDVSSNQFIGTLPYQLFTSLSKLTYLNLRSNLLSGSLPSVFTSFQYVDLSSNQFTGTLPRNLLSTLAVDYVNLTNNNFFGCAPLEPTLRSNVSLCALGGYFYTGCDINSSKCQAEYKNDCKVRSGFYGPTCKPCACPQGFLCLDGLNGTGLCEKFNPCKNHNCEGSCNINGESFTCTCTFPAIIDLTDKRSCSCPEGFYKTTHNGTGCYPCSKIDNCFSNPLCSNQNDSRCEKCLLGYKLEKEKCVINKECTFDDWSAWSTCLLCEGARATRYRNLSLYNTALPVYCQSFLTENELCGYPCLKEDILSADAALEHLYRSFTQFNWLTNQIGQNVTVSKKEGWLYFTTQTVDNSLSTLIINTTRNILPSVSADRYLTETNGQVVSFSVKEEGQNRWLVPVAVVIPLVLLVLFLALYFWTRDERWIKTLPKELQIYFLGYKSWSKEGNFYMRKVSAKDEHFLELWSLLGTQGLTVSEVYQVCNPLLGANFANYRTVLAQRIRDAPILFAKQDWLLKDGNAMLRNYVHERYKALTSYFSWNKEEVVPVLACLHGTDFSIAKSIASKGFCALASLDAGFYGKGIYFTTYGQYAVPYFINRQEPTVLITLGVFGNAYPVIERPEDRGNLVGQPTISGYQSHFVLTKPDGHPITEMHTPEEYNELVVSQEAQVVPVYLVRIAKGHKLEELTKRPLSTRADERSIDSLLQPLIVDESYI